MKAFLVRRLLSMVVSAWLVVTVVFFLARITGDPVSLLIPSTATDAEIAQLTRDLGLDGPVYEQYLRFLSRAWRGDFGQSIRHVEPAFSAVLRYLPATLELALASMLIAVVFGVLAGVLAALRRGTFTELVTMVLALIGQSIPVFWMGLMLMMVFGVHLGWLPVSGRGSLAHLIMPAITLGTTRMAAFCRLTRAGVLEQLGQDYIRTARSKGLGEARVVIQALRNAAIPLTAQIGLSFGYALSGSVITETIFAWPGLGRFALQAVQHRDFPVVQASVFVVALTFLVINFLMDAAYVRLDPRIRFD